MAQDETKALIWAALVDFRAGHIDDEAAVVNRILAIPEIRDALKARSMLTVNDDGSAVLSNVRATGPQS